MTNDSDIIDILTPGKNSYNNNPEIGTSKIRDALIELLRKNNIDNSLLSRRDDMNHLFKLFANIYATNNSDQLRNLLGELNKLLGRLLCSSNIDNICHREDNEFYLIDPSQLNQWVRNLRSPKDYFNRTIRELEEKERSARDDRREEIRKMKNLLNKIKDILLVTSNDINEKYKNALNKLYEMDPNNGYIALLAYIYLKIVANYNLFDNLEWFLVLLSRAFSNASTRDNQMFLPVCPTKKHAVTAFYEIINRYGLYTEGRTDINFRINITNFIERLLQNF